MSDISYLIFLITFLIVVNLLFLMYDSNLCPTVQAKEFNYSQFNQTDPDVYDYLKSSKCEGLPSWYYLIFNSPFLIGIGLIVKKYVLI